MQLRMTSLIIFTAILIVSFTASAKSEGSCGTCPLTAVKLVSSTSQALGNPCNEGLSYSGTVGLEGSEGLTLVAEAEPDGPAGDGIKWLPAEPGTTGAPLPTKSSSEWVEFELASTHGILAIEMRVTRTESGLVLAAQARASLNPTHFAGSPDPNRKLHTDWFVVSPVGTDQVKATFEQKIDHGESIWSLSFSKLTGPTFTKLEEIFPPPFSNPDELLPGLLPTGATQDSELEALHVCKLHLAPNPWTGQFPRPLTLQQTFLSYFGFFPGNYYGAHFDSRDLSWEGQYAYGTVTDRHTSQKLTHSPIRN